MSFGSSMTWPSPSTIVMLVIPRSSRGERRPERPAAQPVASPTLGDKPPGGGRSTLTRGNAYNDPAGGPVDDHPDRLRNLGAHQGDIDALREASQRERELHLGEREPDARARAPAIRHPRAVDSRLLTRVRLGEACGTELERIVPEVGKAPCDVRRPEDHRALLDREVAEHQVALRLARAE